MESDEDTAFETRPVDIRNSTLHDDITAQWTGVLKFISLISNIRKTVITDEVTNHAAQLGCL